MSEEIQNQDLSNEQESERKAFYRRKRVMLPLILLMLVLFFSVKIVINSYMYQTTDDAFVEGHSVMVAPKVSGHITQVYVDDNQPVKKGQLIAQIDERDYKVKYEQAEARLEAALQKQSVASVNLNLISKTSVADYGNASAGIDSAKSQMNFAKQDFSRVSKLYSRGIVSKQDYDKASTALDVAQKNLEQAIERQNSADTISEQMGISDAQLKAATAEIKLAKAALKQAQLDLSYTKIYAPQDGNVTGKSVESGAFVQSGQPLLALVPNRRWIVANFKETQLTHMRAGQSVNIKIDTYPNKIFKGKVDSIQSATGAKASLFPPENAVGSFVKVVQRVPVKIVFTDADLSKFNIVPGMSVVPEVRVR